MARARTGTHAHTDKYVILIAFPRQQWFANASQCYVIRTLHVLLLLQMRLLAVRVSCRRRLLSFRNGVLFCKQLVHPVTGYACPTLVVRCPQVLKRRLLHHGTLVTCKSTRMWTFHFFADIAARTESLDSSWCGDPSVRHLFRPRAE